MKIELNNIVTEDRFYKALVEHEKKDFLEIIKKLQVQDGKKFSVYAIAAKIARGEHVSSEEMAYIRQNAPTLLAEAKEQNREREKTERGENSTSKETKSANQVDNNSKSVDENPTKTDVDLADVDNNNSVSALLNKIIIGWFL